jgi:hypothetical protein
MNYTDIFGYHEHKLSKYNTKSLLSDLRGAGQLGRHTLLGSATNLFWDNLSNPENISSQLVDSDYELQERKTF